MELKKVNSKSSGKIEKYYKKANFGIFGKIRKDLEEKSSKRISETEEESERGWRPANRGANEHQRLRWPLFSLQQLGRIALLVQQLDRFQPGIQSHASRRQARLGARRVLPEP